MKLIFNPSSFPLTFPVDNVQTLIQDLQYRCITSVVYLPLRVCVQVGDFVVL